MKEGWQLAMDGIRIHKRKNGIMLLVLLLSFFCVMHNGRDEYLTHGGDEWEQSVSAADGTEVSRGTEWLLEGQYHFGDEYRTPPRVTGTPDVWCFFAETLLYGTLFGGMALMIRRFSGRMIILWKNIVYIHQTDGKKGNALFVS